MGQCLPGLGMEVSHTKVRVGPKAQPGQGPTQNKNLVLMTFWPTDFESKGEKGYHAKLYVCELSTL